MPLSRLVRLRPVALAALVLLVACATDSASPDAADDVGASADAAAPDAGAPADTAGPDAGDGGPRYPFDDQLTLHHIQMRATHNSYHVAPDPTGPEWDYTHAPLDVQAADLGIRQFEIDVHYDAELGFRVFHATFLDAVSTCDTFVECLGVLRGWSDANPGHHAIVVFVEPKDRFDMQKIAGHYDELEADVLAAWPRERLLTPDDVRGDHPTLRAALAADGWPTLGATRDRLMLVMLDSDDHAAGYTEGHPQLDGRLMFLRCDEHAAPPDWCGVVEVGDARGRQDEIRDLVNERFLVRVHCDSTDADRRAENPARRDAALASGGHFLNTDFPCGSPGVDADAYCATIPDGTPSRCNPVSAPDFCTPEAIEDL